MLDRFKLHRKGFVDVVAWIMIVLGGLGVAIAILQAPVALLMDDFREMRGYWLLAFVQFLLLLSIGVGIRRRRRLARVALLAVLGLTILWHIYWVVAIATRTPLPLVPDSFVTSDLFRFPALGMALFWSLVYGWVAIRFLRRDVAAEFGRRDVEPARQPDGPSGHGPCLRKARARPTLGLRASLDERGPRWLVRASWRSWSP